MIDLNDFKHVEVKIHDSLRKNKLYRAYCDKCNSDKGYKPKNYKNPKCNKCAKSGIKYKSTDENSTSIKGRICYRDTCIHCGKDKGYVRPNDLSKRCKSCSNSIKAKGRPSIKKGIKTNIPAPNRGQYFYNADKRRLRNAISRRMRHCINKQRNHIFDILNYSIDELKLHLESKFQPGMTWDNYGRKQGIRCWHVDHVIPESFYNYSSFEDKQFKQCWALENLQPLWEDENIRKGNRLDFLCRKV